MNDETEMMVEDEVFGEEVCEEELKDIYNMGFHHGKELVQYNIHDVEITADTSIEEFEELIVTLAYDADEGYRCYSPFEFTAYRFNQASNSEECWEQYDTGISDGICKAVSELLTEEFLAEFKDARGLNE